MQKNYFLLLKKYKNTLSAQLCVQEPSPAGTGTEVGSWEVFGRAQLVL